MKNNDRPKNVATKILETFSLDASSREKIVAIVTEEYDWRKDAIDLTDDEEQQIEAKIMNLMYQKILPIYDVEMQSKETVQLLLEAMKIGAEAIEKIKKQILSERNAGADSYVSYHIDIGDLLATCVAALICNEGLAMNIAAWPARSLAGSIITAYFLAVNLTESIATAVDKAIDGEFCISAHEVSDAMKILNDR